MSVGTSTAASSHIPASAANAANARAAASVKTEPVPANSELSRGASYLGKLNAAHASDTALSHASPKSVVGALGLYKTTVVAANANIATYTNAVANDQTAVSNAQAAVTTAQATLAAANAANPVDPAAVTTAQAALTSAQTNLTSAQAQLSQDQASLLAAQQAVTGAEAALAKSTNVTLTAQVVSKLNAMLGIQ